MKPEERELTKYTSRKCILGNHLAQPIIIKQTSWFKLFFLFIIVTLLAGASALAVVTYGVAPQVATNYICGDPINQSLILGFKEGVKFTSDFVLNTATLPVFLENGSTQYLNLNGGTK